MSKTYTKSDILKQYRDVNPKQKFDVLHAKMKMPIATIRGYANLLKQDRDGVLPEEYKTWIDAIISSADHLQDVLEIMLGEQK